MAQSYDFVARYYDLLSRAVFGNALVRVQQYLIRAIPARASLLIVGGGTGWILEEIAKVHPAGLSITYVDASAKMVALARKRNAGGNAVTFVAAPIETISIEERFDVVLTPFLFDNFQEDTARKIFWHIHERMNDQAPWLFCDFKETKKLWQQVVLRIMYVFFRVFCGIESQTLPDVAACFAQYNYKLVEQRMFLGGFVEAIVYQRH